FSVTSTMITVLTDPSSTLDFYFSRSRHLRRLHSFPTRRSSDLPGRGRDGRVPHPRRRSPQPRRGSPAGRHRESGTGIAESVSSFSFILSNASRERIAPFACTDAGRREKVPAGGENFFKYFRRW